MDISIKWPNDIYHHRNKKVGGIICQSHYNGRAFDVTIGIGINISNKKPTICMDEIASKLQKKEVALGRSTVLASFCNRFTEAINTFRVYGFEPFMLKVAPDYPEIQFVGCTNQGSWNDGLDNTHNAFANIYEGRYLAGVAAGMKLQQLIDEGTIKPEEAVIGYVGAFSFAEVISGMTSYFLGARSVCPSVTMKVQFVGSWSDATEESNAASALCDLGCKLISQHSDNTTPATMAQSKGAFHTGYNNDMTGVAPDASIIGCRIDWTNYFVYAIESVANGQEFDQDYCYGYDHGDVVLTELNEKIAAPGTAEKLAEVEAGLADGSIKVFDTSTFTVEGETLTSAFALDTDGDFTPDSEEAVFDGAFHESYFQSAPYFAIKIDGIEWLNSAF